MSSRLIGAYSELFARRLTNDDGADEQAAAVAVLEAGPEGARAERVQRGLELDRPALLLLYLLTAAERDPRILAAARDAHGDSRRTAIDAASASTALGLGLPTVLAAAATLRRLDLLVDWPAELPHRPFAPLVAVTRIADALLGEDRMPDALDAIAALHEERGDVTALIVPPAAVDTLRPVLASRSDSPAVVILQGVEGVGKRALTVAVAAEHGLPTLVVDALELPHDPAALRATMTAIVREARLRDAIVLIDSADTVAGTARRQILASALANLHRPPVLASTGAAIECAPRGRAVIRVELPVPDPAGRELLWARRLGDRASPEDIAAIAMRYPVAPGLIARASAAALLVSTTQISPDDIKTAIGAELAERFRGVGTRVDKRERWTDVVLPSETQDAITELVSRVRHRRQVVEEWGFGGRLARGLGLSVLFSGEPGTGKTMVAALIAQELGLQLYQIDLANLVSKYVGETEKNLAKAFDAAEAGHAVLLFDEADALFGKRSGEVKSASDRYANMEINYLLQRIEQFTGVAILTTNLITSIDPAFQRRLAAHVRFEMPDDDARAELWRRMIPKLAPRQESIDFRTLGRSYKFSGGYIRNAVVRAAYLAAAEATEISMDHLRRAADLEAWEMGRVGNT